MTISLILDYAKPFQMSLMILKIRYSKLILEIMVFLIQILLRLSEVQ